MCGTGAQQLSLHHAPLHTGPVVRWHGSTDMPHRANRGVEPPQQSQRCIAWLPCHLHADTNGVVQSLRVHPYCVHTLASDSRLLSLAPACWDASAAAHASPHRSNTPQATLSCSCRVDGCARVLCGCTSLWHRTAQLHTYTNQFIGPCVLKDRPARA